MDYNNIGHQNYFQAGTTSAKFNYLQVVFPRTLQVVVLLSLLSLFLCYSWGFSLFPHSFNVYFSTYLLSLFTRTLERKYMFLICNGILAFLAKSSVSCSSSSSSSPLDPSELGGQVKMKEAARRSEEGVPVLKASTVVDVSFVDEDGEQGKSTEQEEDNKEKNDQALREEDEDNDGEEEEGNGLSPSNQVVVVEEEEEEEEEEDEGVVDQGTAAANEELASTEELNKKFEEFIRKMKEEIRIEAQQQLIAV